MVRSFRKKVVSSADLVQKFEATWTPAQFESHIAAGEIIDRLTREAFARAGESVSRGENLTEHELQQWFAEQFRAHDIVTDDLTIVAVGPHTGDPHYEPLPGKSSPIRKGDLLLLDVWGKMAAGDSVYYDITWTGFLGDQVPAKIAAIFSVVKAARDAAVSTVRTAVQAGKAIHGWEVDRAARDVIRKAGYARYFTHRTGLSIGREVHGNGANMDNLETRDDRTILPHTCFSVEPGIYLPEFGIRSEVNVYVDEGQARVTGAMQNEVIPILA
jgi:Xaa-Pro aminopeptidase